MENSLKQRIIGAVVLVALAVIFLPAVLKEKASNGTFVSKIPKQPKELQDYKVDTKKIDDIVEKQKVLFADNNLKPDDEGNLLSDKPLKKNVNKLNLKVKRKIVDPKIATKEDTEKVIKEVSEDTNKKVTDSDVSNNNAKSIKEDRTISKSYIDAAWVIQVASFSKESNATGLVKRLKLKSYKAYRRKIMVSSNTVFRVFVGPYITKPLAKKAIQSINKVSETKSIIKVFDPIKH